MAMSQEQTLQLLKPMFKGKDWENFSAFLSDKREALVTQLISCKPEDVAQIQGRVKCLDELLRLPSQIV